MSKYGCDEVSVTWFSDYLRGRKQTTIANDTRSTSKSVTCGVPQGSVLGPLLFIIYINDVVSCLENCSHYLYADDLAIVVSGKSIDILVQLLQTDLDSLGKWCSDNKLTVNTKKTQVMWCYSMCNPPDLDDCSVTFCTNILKQVKNFNYLGIIIDHDLSFKAHCSKVRSMAYSRFYQLCNIKINIDELLSLRVYKTMILPVFDYCDYIICSGPVTAV